MENNITSIRNSIYENNKLYEGQHCDCCCSPEESPEEETKFDNSKIRIKSEIKFTYENPASIKNNKIIQIQNSNIQAGNSQTPSNANKKYSLILTCY